MATKENVIPVPTPVQMQLTTNEADTLRERFRADLANVVSARPESESIVQETNITRILPKPRRKPSKKKPSKKKPSKKKPARKPGKKKPSTKKAARKPSKKK